MAKQLEIFLSDDAATAALGSALMPLLVPGDVVLLHGDLGAGKTALARAIIRAWLNDPSAEVPSPSFAIVQPYERNGETLLHADLYRLAAATELDELGLTDAADTIVLVEWPENAPGLIEIATLKLSLSLGPKGKGRHALIGFTQAPRQADAHRVLSRF